MIFLIVTFFLSLSFSNNLYLSQSQSILNNINNQIKNFNIKEKSSLNFFDIMSSVFYNFNKQCAEDLKIMNPEEYNMTNPSKYPKIISYIGLTINDIEDEMECLESLAKTIYLIVVINTESFTNQDDRVLLDFLNMTEFSVGGCVTEACKDPLLVLATMFQSFSNTEENITDGKKTLEPELVRADKNDVSPNEKIYFILFIVLIVYSCFKITIGIYRLLTIQKGYELTVARELNKKGKLHIFDDNNIDFFNENNIENENLNTYEYNPKYDLSSYYPKHLRIIRFFDIFNDIMLLTKRRNRYYNDNGLECINFLRAIVLYFYIFSNTFNTLLEMPSKDKLNKSFFSSNLLFFYRLSTNAAMCWIFLEGSYGAYKLMKFFNSKMSEYYRENKNKNYVLIVLFIFIKFIFLFIPKVCIFIFCFFIFYYDIKKFSGLFSAKTIFKFIVERVISKDKKCSDSLSFIFKSFFTFKNDSSNFKICYDFTFIYINILFCILVFVLSLYIMFLVRKSMIEIFFLVFYFVFFFGLTLLVKDDNNDSEIYSYYHFKGQEYATKIAYLSLGVYNLGFILGIICFNYDHIKSKAYEKINQINQNINKNIINEKQSEINKDGKPEINDSNTISSISKNSKSSDSYEKRAYYPLSFLNYTLIAIHKKKLWIKILIVLFCFILQIIIACFFQIYGIITKDNPEYASKKQKGNKDYDPNFERNYYLEMKFNWVLQGYFLFEKHFFLIFFFIICITLITFPKNGIFDSLINSKLITVISRTGFTMVCLSYILSNFFFIGLNKIKFSILSFVILSIGNFLIIFFISFFLNIIFELPLRRIVKKLLRIKSSQYNIKLKYKEKRKFNDIISI